MSTVNKTIVTIDGPSGAGKSTISRLLAARLNYKYLDTGAMYRAVGLQIERRQVDLQDDERLADLLANIALDLVAEAGDTKVMLDNEDVSAAIRTPEMGLVASRVSAHPLVRQKLTGLQREIGNKGSIVTEGRDMGTVVFPNAGYKFYLDASPEERARRRVEQLRESGQDVDAEAILAQIIKRDHDDSSREHAPLKAADDAINVDSSKMNVDEVVGFMLKYM